MKSPPQTSILLTALAAPPLVINAMASHTAVKHPDNQPISRYLRAAEPTTAAIQLKAQANHLASPAIAFALSNCSAPQNGRRMAPTFLPQYMATAHSERDQNAL